MVVNYVGLYGSGVNGFTLDVSIGDFLSSHPNMTTPPMGQIARSTLVITAHFLREFMNTRDYTNNKG